MVVEVQHAENTHFLQQIQIPDSRVQAAEGKLLLEQEARFRDSVPKFP